MRLLYPIYSYFSCYILQLIFEGTTGIHNRDEIAIDDVDVYQSEQCPQGKIIMKIIVIRHCNDNRDGH